MQPPREIVAEDALLHPAELLVSRPAEGVGVRTRPRTWASLFGNDKIERVPLMVRAPLARPAGRRRACLP